MKKIFTFLALFFFSYLFAYAQQDIVVGKEPIKIYFDEFQNGFHVLCKGYDENYDNEKTTENDENPSWWFLSESDGGWSAEKKMEFEFNSFKFPFRSAVMWDNDESTLFMPLKNVVKTYDLNNYEEIDDNLINYDVRGIATSGYSHLFLTINDFISVSEVRVFSLGTGQVLQTLQAEVNPQMSVQYITSANKTGIAILNEGDWGAENSTLQLGEIVHMGNFELKSIDLGDMGNYLYYNENYPDFLYVVVNGSDKIVIIDLIKQEIYDEIELDYLTSPRECEIIDNNLVVTTYSGDLYFFDIDTYELTAKKSADSFSESIAFNDDVIAISNISNSDYSPNNVVRLFPRSISSITELPLLRNDMLVYPQPANNSLNFDIPDNQNINLIQIFDLQGNMLWESNNSQNQINLDLNSGNFYLKVTTESNIYISKIVISK